MNQRIAKELRKTFQYTKPKDHEGYIEKYSGQRIKEVFTIDKDAEGKSIVRVRQEPVNMTTLTCKSTDRRFYKAVKKLFNKASTKTSAEIKVMLTDLYKSEGL